MDIGSIAEYWTARQYFKTVDERPILRYNSGNVRNIFGLLCVSYSRKTECVRHRLPPTRLSDPSFKNEGLFSLSAGPTDGRDCYLAA